MITEEITAEMILKEVSKYVNKDVTYIDALVHFAETHGVEVEVIGEIIKRTPVLKAKVHDDAEKLNLVERTAKLPI